MACLWSKSSITEKHIYKSLNLEHYTVHSMRIILLHYRCALKKITLTAISTFNPMNLNIHIKSSSFLWTRMFQEQLILNDTKIPNTGKANKQYRESRWILKQYYQSNSSDISLYSCSWTQLWSELRGHGRGTHKSKRSIGEGAPSPHAGKAMHSVQNTTTMSRAKQSETTQAMTPPVSYAKSKSDF